MKKVVVILGPTATGKTDLALQLAKKLKGELVSVDSRQVYVGLNIGTGKLPGKGKWEVRLHKGFWEIGGIRVWMYDVANPKKQYNVVDYVKVANKVISGILERGKLPIVIGGTGFYLKALLEGLDNLSVPVDKKLREKLKVLSLKDLQNKLQKNSPERWQKMNYSDRQNPRRLVRAIELTLTRTYIRNLIPTTSRFTKQVGMTNRHVLKIGITAPREVLYKRVDERVVTRINQGMIEEAKKLYSDGLSLKRMRQLGLEYGVLADYLAGKIKNQDELTKIIQNKIHDYVRRQLTWFKKEQDVNWFDITDKLFPQKIAKKVAQWYD